MTNPLGVFRLLVIFVVLAAVRLAGQQAGDVPLPPIAERTRSLDARPGFFSMWLDRDAGKVLVELPADAAAQPFLHVDTLESGLGSNPVGLDRGAIGRERVVRFRVVGHRVLLEELNLKFRAPSGSAAEQRAVRESFASAVLWAGDVVARTEGRSLIDLTEFLLQDVHGIARRLEGAGQGSFALDAKRCAIFPEDVRAFPDNCELTAVLTFASSAPGPLVREVAADGGSVSLRVRHSLVRLPDGEYRPRRFDPRVGVFGIRFADYGSAIDQPLETRVISRHRLRRRDPATANSPAVEPIVYYVDSGIPEPVRSAVLEGARWWNDAFAAAGYVDAFRVELLPEDADPLDVRLNVIQWVHRSTRGWSYGSSVVDPRTGEIIKGHVRLGSLRVRQDRLLIEGLEPSFKSTCGCGLGSTLGPADVDLLADFDPAVDRVAVALARIRQLAAHEVGHTLGFAHNFAASVNDRASVMDYPAPLVGLDEAKGLDLSRAYAVGIGAWDRITTRYAYADFAPGTDEDRALRAIVQEAADAGLLFLTDADARSAEASHPRANLWDNGSDPVAELEHVLAVRRFALARFGPDNVPRGRPMSELELMLVPLFLHHRYQLDAAAKLLGGVEYGYEVRGHERSPNRPVPPDWQRRALRAVLRTMEVDALTLRPALLAVLAPPPFGYGRDAEAFTGRLGAPFDPLAAAEVAARLSVRALLQPERAARLTLAHALDPAYPGFKEVVEALLVATWGDVGERDGYSGAVRRVIQTVVLDELIALQSDPRALGDVRAVVAVALGTLAYQDLGGTLRSLTETDQAHRAAARTRLERFLGRPWVEERTAPLATPPGSPIGAARER